MRKAFYILLLLLTCVSCEWRLKSADGKQDGGQVVIERYDRIEGLYLTTGDYSALQQMNISYPMQTRMLIEDVLRIGKVDDPDINTKFLHFFQDSILQCLLSDVQHEFADMDDLNSDLTAAFLSLKQELPSVHIPLVYTQIGSFDQSIIVGSNTLGISLDKYLGEDYPFYRKNYSDRQRRMMVRSMIVPDCMGFYILSLFPMPHDRNLSQADRDMHMAKIQWVVNRITRQGIFRNQFVARVERYMKRNKHVSVEQLLRNNVYSDIH